ncbi:hypothetical protein GGF31_007136 [Allomyces arbusculus]|nr:hypothetical protein GGF31_007136 [Allomyces arbusculus]
MTRSRSSTARQRLPATATSPLAASRPLTAGAAAALLATAAVLVLLPLVAHARPLINAPVVSSTGAITTTHPSDPRALRYLNDVSVGSAFQIKFTCDATDQAFCRNAESALQRAAQRIASVFKFRRTMTVSVAMFLPCDTSTPDPQSCDEYSTLGFALPTTRIPVIHKDDGVTYMYPTPLLKQLDLAGVAEGQVPWPEYDILARFNSLRNWWFSTSGTNMNSTQRDLEFVATHELYHGLGFGDDLAMSNQFDQKSPELLPYYNSFPPESQPPPSATVNTMPYNGNVFFRFAEPSIWNRFTYLADRPVLDYYKVLNDTFNALVQAKSPSLQTVNVAGTKSVAYSPASVISALQRNDKAGTIMEALHTYGTTANKLVFKTSVWPAGTTLTSNLVLESSLDPFMDGSSLAHTTIAANVTSEFLMVYATAVRSFKTAIDATKAPASGIGPITKDVLLAMGYTSADAQGFTSRKDVADIDPRALRAPGTSSTGDATNSTTKKSAAAVAVAGTPAVSAAVALAAALMAVWV